MAGLSPAVAHCLVSPAKDALMKCAEFMETFQALHPEEEPGNRVVDLYPQCVMHHLTPWPSDDHYDNYVKSLDTILDMAHADPLCVYMASDASSLPRGELQAALAFLVFQGRTKMAHIVAAGGRRWPPMPNLWH